MSESIVQNCISKFDLRGKHISIFLPIERFREILTWKLLDENATFYLPVVKKDRKLVHIRFDSKDQLKESEWGIPEPIYGEEFDPSVLDIVLVPLLAIDQGGHRVGYGAGFYDSFLSVCRKDCRFVGLSYYDPIERIEDRLETDIPLHFCITPGELIEFQN